MSPEGGGNRYVPSPSLRASFRLGEHSSSERGPSGPAARGRSGAAVQSRHNDAGVSTGTMAPDGGGWGICRSAPCVQRPNLWVKIRAELGGILAYFDKGLWLWSG